MRRLHGFQAAAATRPFRRICHSCRHIAASSVQTAAAASAAPSLHLVSSSRTLFTHSPPRSSNSQRRGDTDEEWMASAEGHPDVGSSSKVDDLEKLARAEAQHDTAFDAAEASPIAASSPATAAPLTLDRVEAFVRRHEHLCDNMFLFSTSPGLSAAVAARGSVFGQPADVHRDSTLSRYTAERTTTSDGEHRHSSQAVHASDAVVSEVRDMLDRVAQESHVLGSLSDRQRHRLVVDVCRIGFVLGLHSRCCALYVDMVLLASHTVATANATSSSNADADLGAGRDPLARVESAVADGGAVFSPDSTMATTETAKPSLHPDASPFSIPDFVLEAAGAAADLPTLTHCLAYAARAMQVDALAQTDLMDDLTFETSSGWLVALQVFVQCVRVALQHGWHGSPKPCSGAPAQAMDAETELEAAADSQEEQKWHDFTMQALRCLRVRAGEEKVFFAVVLRRTRYHYADAGGDWSAAQAAIYASCFRHCLGEDAAITVNVSSVRPNSSQSRNRNRRSAAASNPAESSTQNPSPPVARLTCPALIVLLRTAVAARQYDIAEWATLYVDAFLEETCTGASRTTHDTSSSPSLAHPSRLSSAATLQLDVLLVWYLRYLQQSAQHHRACRWLRRLRHRAVTSAPLAAALPSLALLRVAARLAGDVLDADLALWCLQLCLSSALTSPPTHHDIFACLCAFARCGLPTFDMVLQSLLSNNLLHPSEEELLFVRLLHARRSVHGRREWEQCLQPYVVLSAGPAQSGWTRTERRETGEEPDGERPGAHEKMLSLLSETGVKGQGTLTVTLRLFATPEPRVHAAPTGVTGSSSSVSPLGMDLSSQETNQDRDGHRIDTSLPARSANPSPAATVFSARVIHHILLLLQEGEHPAFMAFYRTFLFTFSEHVTVGDRARWAVLALAWASRQHGSTPLTDVVYMVREVEQLMGLQVDYYTRCQSSSREGSAASSPARPLPIAADLYRSLERRWAALYEQYPPSWWTSMTAGATPLMDAAALQRMTTTARVFAAASGPAFARFTKKRHCLPCADVTAADMLRTSVRRSAEWSDTTQVAAAGVLPSRLTSQKNKVLHQLDRERWAAYVVPAEN